MVIRKKDDQTSFFHRNEIYKKSPPKSTDERDARNKFTPGSKFHDNFHLVGLALTAMLSGVIVDRGGYGQLLMFFLSFQGLAMFAALALWKRHGANCTPIEGEM